MGVDTIKDSTPALTLVFEEAAGGLSNGRNRSIESKGARSGKPKWWDAVDEENADAEMVTRPHPEVRLVDQKVILDAEAGPPQHAAPLPLA